MDLVRRLGHGALHRLLVLVGENRRHGGVFRGLELAMVVVRECSSVQPLGLGAAGGACSSLHS
jgi:hypothetical protein